MNMGKLLLITGLLLLPALSLGQGLSESVRFHHMRINAVDPEASQAFYEQFLGAISVQYNNQVPAIFHTHGFVVFNKVDSPAATAPFSPIWHMGWAGVDGRAEYDWLSAQGVEYDTPPTDLGNNTYQYMLGPDKEMVEIYTGAKNHRYEHIHLWATDVKATSDWFVNNLGFFGREAGERPTDGSRWSAFLETGLMNLYIYGVPNENDRVYRPIHEEGLRPSEGSVFNHIAYSFRDIEPVYAHMTNNGVEIIEEISWKEALGYRSFFAMAPDQLLIEIVEAVPVPESMWER